MPIPSVDRIAALFFCAFALASICSCASLRASRGTVDEVPTLTTEELFGVALFHAKRGDFFRAEQYLVAARAAGRDDEATTYWLVRVCISAGRYHSALRHALAHLRHDPTNWRLRLVVASIHEALGDIGRARQELEVVLKTDPRLALPHYRIGMLDRALPGRRASARLHLEEYLALAPGGVHANEVRNTLARWDVDVPSHHVFEEIGP